jgi:hypothetical protein
LGCSTIFNVNITNLVQQTTVNCIVTAAKIDTTPFQVCPNLYGTWFTETIVHIADIFDQEIFNGQIKPGGTATSVASSATGTATKATGTATKATATGTTATTATPKAAKAAIGTSTAASSAGTGTGTGPHHHFRGLRARNVWVQEAK